MSKKQNTLETFFSVKRKSDLSIVTDVTETKLPRTNETPVDNLLLEGCSSSSNFSQQQVACLSGRPMPEQCPVNDISYFINRVLTDEDGLKILHDCWSPPKNYQFPLIKKFTDKK